MPILLKLFPKLVEEEILSNSFYKATITLMAKPDKDILHKRENYKSISLMNIHVKILNKILPYKIHQVIKKTIHYDQASLIPQLVKNPPAMQETPVQFLGQEGPLEKG